MKTRTPNTKRAGFTLVEMIGVLAIIAILTALLVPKIFDAITSAKINNSVMNYNVAKAAVAAHYGEHGRFAMASGTGLNLATGPYDDWDQQLVYDGHLEQLFSMKIGNQKIGSANNGSYLRVVDISGLDSATDTVSAPETPAAAGAGTYRFVAQDATGTGASAAETALVDVTGSMLVEAVVQGVNIADARELNSRIDGGAGGLGEQDWGDGSGGVDATGDFTGRVKYEVGASAPEVTVYMYVAHR